MNTAEKVLKSLIETGVLPSSGLFEINDSLLNIYCSRYKMASSPSESSSYRANSPCNIRYQRKVAGVVLNRLLESRIPVKVISHENKLYMNTKSGFVYVLTNPAFEGYYKIGMTTDLNKRLQTYQTYDPHRQYKIHHNVFVSDRRETERKVLESFNVSLVKGEWIKSDEVLKIFHSIVEEKLH